MSNNALIVNDLAHYAADTLHSHVTRVPKSLLQQAIDAINNTTLKRRLVPSRRQGFCLKLEWRDRGLNALPWEHRGEGISFFVHVNFYEPDEWKTVGEVFADIGKTPSSLQQVVAAACIIISVSIQCGVPLEELLKSQPRYDPTPDFPQGEHFTILGIILQELVNRNWEEKENENLKPNSNPVRRASTENDQQGGASGVSGVDPNQGPDAPDRAPPSSPRRLL